MTASFPSRLTDLQLRFLREFVGRDSRFFLTGGAVLAGWILGHRPTQDLDLFTTDDAAMADGDRTVRATASAIGAAVESVQSSPDFRRYLVQGEGESVVIDLVRDRAPQLRVKVERDGIPMDPVEEIVVNKICALVGRAEVRDLVDLYHLEQAGYRIEGFISDAARKDGGVTPAIVAWVVSGLSVPDALPGGLDPEKLGVFLRDLERRMRRLAAPGAESTPGS